MDFKNKKILFDLIKI